MKSQSMFIFWAIYLTCMPWDLVAHRCDAQEPPATPAAPGCEFPGPGAECYSARQEHFRAKK